MKKVKNANFTLWITWLLWSKRLLPLTDTVDFLPQPLWIETTEKVLKSKITFCRLFFNISGFLDMNEQEAYDLMKSCVKEVQKRLIINLPNFQVQTISKEGIKNLEDITVKNLD